MVLLDVYTSVQVLNSIFIYGTSCCLQCIYIYLRYIWLCIVYRSCLYSIFIYGISGCVQCTGPVSTVYLSMVYLVVYSVQVLSLQYINLWYIWMCTLVYRFSTVYLFMVHHVVYSAQVLSLQYIYLRYIRVCTLYRSYLYSIFIYGISGCVQLTHPFSTVYLSMVYLGVYSVKILSLQ